FEPFDEAEARRVGADDILTKPFQSIRRLIDRVGALVSSPPAEKALEKEGPTAELPRPEEEPAEEPRLNTSELEMTTADTLPLEGHPLRDTLPRVEQLPVSEPASGVSPSARLEALLDETQPSRLESDAEVESSEPEGTMEPAIPEASNDSQRESADVLLDLGELEAARAEETDDFVLDLDDEVAPGYDAPPMRAFVEPEVRETVASASAYESYQPQTYQPETYQPANSHSSFTDTQDVPFAPDHQVENVTAAEPVYEYSAPPELTPDPVPVFGETEFPVAEAPATSYSEPTTSDYVNRAAQSFSADQLSPEMIDAIARRAVELMSDKVIREIAWEVVPDLAELLIKRQLEEKAK
ncbi:MAG TPA: hypothetical protein VJS17_08660, partial [Pyrinomonadaceae bacterium]|nr:hypothetical protein [Pyrinomonadaceae bacterium]